jgi:hypothetical protein
VDRGELDVQVDRGELLVLLLWERRRGLVPPRQSRRASWVDERRRRRGAGRVGRELLSAPLARGAQATEAPRHPRGIRRRQSYGRRRGTATTAGEDDGEDDWEGCDLISDARELNGQELKL